MIDPNIADLATQAESQISVLLTHFLNSKLLDNQFLIGGVGTVLLSSVLYLLKNLPFQIWASLKHRFSVSIDIFSINSNFHVIAKELNDHIIHLFSRTKVLDKRDLTIGMGESWTFFNGRLVYVKREKEKSDSREFKQNLRLVFPFSTNKRIEKLFIDFFKKQDSQKNENIKVYKFSRDYLEFMKYIPKRSEKSIFVPEETLNYIKERITFFLNNRKWYEEHGIPYKYAILLHGVPGTGKTTIAKYIASYTNRNLVNITPSKLPMIVSHVTPELPGMGDPDEVFFDDHQNNSSEKYVGLMEDIDCDDITQKRKETSDDDEDDVQDTSSFKKMLVNLSDLLNSIDGINSPEDFILVATTNHINSIDPALFRKGRFDDVIEVKPLEAKEIVRMIDNFFGSDVSKKFKNVNFNPIPGAVLQDLLLQYMDKDKKLFIEKMKEYENEPNAQKI